MSHSKPEDYIKYRILRANETISEVKILIDNKLWNTAITECTMLASMQLGHCW